MIVPRPLDFVKAKNSAVVPVPTLNIAEADPAVELTGLKTEDRFETTNAFCRVTETAVPGVIALIENFSASEASIWLSEGTLTIAGVEAAFAVVIETPFMVKTMDVFARAEGLTKNVETTPKPIIIAVNFFLYMMPHLYSEQLAKMYLFVVEIEG